MFRSRTVNTLIGGQCVSCNAGYKYDSSKLYTPCVPIQYACEKSTSPCRGSNIGCQNDPNDPANKILRCSCTRWDYRLYDALSQGVREIIGVVFANTLE